MSSLTSSNAASVQPPVRPEYERQLESPGALAAAQPLSCHSACGRSLWCGA